MGKGGFGKVYKGNYHHSCVAVKVLNKVKHNLIRQPAIHNNVCMCHNANTLGGCGPLTECGWTIKGGGTCSYTVSL